MEFPKFEPFPSLHRLSRRVIVTEKLDGTNSQIYISDDGAEILAGSRNKWITPQNDNYGFAGWVERNKTELLKLGPGTHFGEWWGAGIQRKYSIGEKRFSLFNTERWGAERPSCCHVVPILWDGIMDTLKIDSVLENLKISGSIASPGFMNPEGIVIFHTAANMAFKKTFDDKHKFQLTPA